MGTCTCLKVIGIIRHGWIQSPARKNADALGQSDVIGFMLYSVMQAKSVNQFGLSLRHGSQR